MLLDGSLGHFCDFNLTERLYIHNLSFTRTPIMLWCYWWAALSSRWLSNDLCGVSVTADWIWVIVYTWTTLMEKFSNLQDLSVQWAAVEFPPTHFLLIHSGYIHITAITHHTRSLTLIPRLSLVSQYSMHETGTILMQYLIISRAEMLLQNHDTHNDNQITDF